MNRILIGALIFAASGAWAQQPVGPTVRLHGMIEKSDASSLLLKERDGRQITLVYVDNLRITEVAPIDPVALQAGKFIGTTAVPGPDGSLSAVEVHVFDEALRGTGEGHRPIDILPNATMTNATVTAINDGPNDRTMTLRYKDGEKTIHVPNGVPIVTMKAGDRSMLVAGAKVTVIGQKRDGRDVATGVLVGRDGFAPPT